MNEKDLRDLLSLPLPVRAQILGRSQWSGGQRTRRRGAGGNFLDLRDYVPTDSLARLDWRVSARTGRWMVREAERLSQLRIAFALDQSASMNYPDGDLLSKKKVATTMVAAAALHAIRQGNSVTFWNGERTLPCRSGRRAELEMLNCLDAAESGGLNLDGMDGFLRRLDLFLFVGDFLDDDNFGEQVRLAAATGVGVRLLHVLHRDEVEFPFRGPYEFDPLDAPGGVRVRLNAQEVAAGYRDRIDDYLADFRQSIDGGSIDYQLYLCGQDLYAATRFLAQGSGH